MNEVQRDLFGNVQVGSYTPFTDRQISKFKRQLMDRVTKYLEDKGLYNPIDSELIAVYVQAISDIRRYSAIIEKEGELYQTKSGYNQHPLISMKQKAFDNSTKLADKLGILSMNRKKLDGNVEDQSGDDSFSEFER